MRTLAAVTAFLVLAPFIVFRDLPSNVSGVLCFRFCGFRFVFGRTDGAYVTVESLTIDECGLDGRTIRSGSVELHS